MSLSRASNNTEEMEALHEAAPREKWDDFTRDLICVTLW
jgi:hypothetical protein